MRCLLMVLSLEIWFGLFGLIFLWVKLFFDAFVLALI